MIEQASVVAVALPVSVFLSLATAVTFVTMLTMCVCCKCTKKSRRGIPHEEPYGAPTSVVAINYKQRNDGGGENSNDPLLHIPTRQLPHPPPPAMGVNQSTTSDILIHRSSADRDVPTSTNRDSLTRESSMSDLYATVDKTNNQRAHGPLGGTTITTVSSLHHQRERVPERTSVRTVVTSQTRDEVTSTYTKFAQRAPQSVTDKNDETTATLADQQPVYDLMDTDSERDPMYTRVTGREPHQYEYPVFQGGRTVRATTPTTTVSGRTTTTTTADIYGAAGSSVTSGDDNLYQRIVPIGQRQGQRGEASSSNVLPDNDDDELREAYSQINKQIGGQSTDDQNVPRADVTRSQIDATDNNMDMSETDGDDVKREPSYRYITVRESLEVLRQRMAEESRQRDERPVGGNEGGSQHYYSTIGSDHGYEPMRDGQPQQPLYEDVYAIDRERQPAVEQLRDREMKTVLSMDADGYACIRDPTTGATSGGQSGSADPRENARDHDTSASSEANRSQRDASTPLRLSTSIMDRSGSGSHLLEAGDSSTAPRPPTSPIPDRDSSDGDTTRHTDFLNASGTRQSIERAATHCSSGYDTQDRPSDLSNAGSRVPSRNDTAGEMSSLSPDSRPDEERGHDGRLDERERDGHGDGKSRSADVDEEGTPTRQPRGEDGRLSHEDDNVTGSNDGHDISSTTTDSKPAVSTDHDPLSQITGKPTNSQPSHESSDSAEQNDRYKHAENEVQRHQLQSVGGRQQDANSRGTTTVPINEDGLSDAKKTNAGDENVGNTTTTSSSGRPSERVAHDGHGDDKTVHNQSRADGDEQQVDSANDRRSNNNYQSPETSPLSKNATFSSPSDFETRKDDIRTGGLVDRTSFSQGTSDDSIQRSSTDHNDVDNQSLPQSGQSSNDDKNDRDEKLLTSHENTNVPVNGSQEDNHAQVHGQSTAGSTDRSGGPKISKPVVDTSITETPSRNVINPEEWKGKPLDRSKMRMEMVDETDKSRDSDTIVAKESTKTPRTPPNVKKSFKMSDKTLLSDGSDNNNQSIDYASSANQSKIPRSPERKPTKQTSHAPYDVTSGGQLRRTPPTSPTQHRRYQMAREATSESMRGRRLQANVTSTGASPFGLDQDASPSSSPQRRRRPDTTMKTNADTNDGWNSSNKIRPGARGEDTSRPWQGGAGGGGEDPAKPNKTGRMSSATSGVGTGSQPPSLQTSPGRSSQFTTQTSPGGTSQATSRRHAPSPPDLIRGHSRGPSPSGAWFPGSYETRYHDPSRLSTHRTNVDHLNLDISAADGAQPHAQRDLPPPPAILQSFSTLLTSGDESDGLTAIRVYRDDDCAKCGKGNEEATCYCHGRFTDIAHVYENNLTQMKKAERLYDSSIA